MCNIYIYIYITFIPIILLYIIYNIPTKTIVAIESHCLSIQIFPREWI